MVRGVRHDLLDDRDYCGCNMGEPIMGSVLGLGSDRDMGISDVAVLRTVAARPAIHETVAQSHGVGYASVFRSVDPVDLYLTFADFFPARLVFSVDSSRPVHLSEHGYDFWGHFAK